MTVKNDFSLPWISLCGVGRGLVVQSLTYPLEVIKTHQQALLSQERSYQIAWRLFQQSGVRSFYLGLTPQLVRSCCNQAWCWPMMTKIPLLLEGSSPAVQQAMTGLAIATVGACVTTPLEKARIQWALEKPFSWKKGWNGIGIHWTKLSAGWCTFLVAQEGLRKRYYISSGKQTLPLSQSVLIGVQVALIVSVTSAPFDVANTLKQSESLRLRVLFSGNILRKMFRGWPLNAATLVVHNTTSVALLDRLRKN